jgi:hypothetical protein
MPDSVPVIAFIIGSVLVIAALIGKDVKIAAVELPALDKPRRAVAAVLGALLMGYGVLDRIEPHHPLPRPASHRPQPTQPSAQRPVRQHSERAVCPTCRPAMC